MTTSAIFDKAIVSAFTTNLGTNGPTQMLWATGNTYWYCMLATTSGCNSGKATWQAYSDVTGQFTGGTNYTAGGNVMAPTTVAIASDVAQFVSSATSWTSATISAVTFAITQYTGTTITNAFNKLMSYHDLGGSQGVTSGTLTLTWAGSGVFTITISAAA